MPVLLLPILHPGSPVSLTLLPVPSVLFRFRLSMFRLLRCRQPSPDTCQVFRLPCLGRQVCQDHSVLFHPSHSIRRLLYSCCLLHLRQVSIPHLRLLLCSRMHIQHICLPVCNPSVLLLLLHRLSTQRLLLLRCFLQVHRLCSS